MKREEIAELWKDKARLDWLEEQGNGIGLIHDDGESWAVETNGVQDIVRACGDKAASLWTSYSVDSKAFRATVREAIDAAMRSSMRGGEEGG